MRRILLFFLGFLILNLAAAQQPQSFQYQAVVRGANGEVLENQSINVTIHFMQGAVDGTEVFSEHHAITTNSQGLVTLAIGSRNPDGFAAVDWGGGPFFIQVLIDDKLLGTTQLLSVPFALHAQTAERLRTPAEESDPVFSSSSAADFTETDLDKLNNLSGVNTGDQDLSELATKQALQDSVTKLRNEFPDTAGIVLKSTLDDTISSIRKDIPDVSKFIQKERDPVFNESMASKLSETELKKLQNLTGKNTGDQDLSNLATKEALEDSIAKLHEKIQTIKKYEVGDFAHGGIVFWVDESNQHGLVCAINDLDSLKWSAGTAGNATMAKGDGPLAGKMNTTIIIASQGSGSGERYAAKACYELQLTQNGRVYADWYLPSFEELLLLHEHIDLINSVAIANDGDSIDTNESYYWTSSEINDSFARLIWFTNGNALQELDSKFFNHKVRPVREY